LTQQLGAGILLRCVRSGDLVFIRAKVVNGTTYYQAVQGYRDEQDRVRHRTVASLGRHATPDEAIAAAQQDLSRLKARLRELGPLAERSKTRAKEAARLRAQVAQLNLQLERLTACAIEMSSSTPDPSQGSDETAEARIPDIRVWRGTPLGRQVLLTFTGRKIRELAAKIERGPGFKDAEARQRFATEMRRWALFWRHQVGPSARPLPKKARSATASLTDPTPGESRDALLRLAGKARQVARLQAELAAELYRLPSAARDALAWHLLPDLAPGRPVRWADLPDDVRPWVQGREAISHLHPDLRRAEHRLRQLADAAKKAAAPIEVRTGPRAAKLGEAIHDLGRIWLELTGEPPRLGLSKYRRGDRGPFGNFVRAVVQLLWPRAGSVDGYIRDVCRSYREQPAQ
jgi:hypothetical protein